MKFELTVMTKTSQIGRKVCHNMTPLWSCISGSHIDGYLKVPLFRELREIQCTTFFFISDDNLVFSMKLASIVLGFLF